MVIQTRQKVLKDWQERLREPSLSVLLVLQGLAMFVIGPLGATGIIHPRTVIFFIVLMSLVSIFLVAKGSMARILILIEFGAIVAGATLRTLFATEKSFLVVETLATLVFLGTVTFIIGRTVFGEGRVSLHRIQGAIVIYLNIALAFGSLDNLILGLWPGAYTNVSHDTRSHLGEMIYFSLTTLTTTGYGDLSPVHPVARGMANLEAVIGQLYITTLIASLVGLHFTHRKEDEEEDKKRRQ
jgi:hypothetical protein